MRRDKTWNDLERRPSSRNIALLLSSICLSSAFNILRVHIQTYSCFVPEDTVFPNQKVTLFLLRIFPRVCTIRKKRFQYIACVFSSKLEALYPISGQHAVTIFSSTASNCSTPLLVAPASTQRASLFFTYCVLYNKSLLSGKLMQELLSCVIPYER